MSGAGCSFLSLVLSSASFYSPSLFTRHHQSPPFLRRVRGARECSWITNTAVPHSADLLLSMHTHDKWHVMYDVCVRTKHYTNIRRGPFRCETASSELTLTAKHRPSFACQNRMQRNASAGAGMAGMTGLGASTSTTEKEGADVSLSCLTELGSELQPSVVVWVRSGFPLM